RARVEETLRREGLDAAHAPGAARAVWNALRCPLPPARRADEAPDAMQSAFRLADLAPEDVRHEVEFLLPFRNDPTRADAPSGVTVRGQFLWGFIDLVY